MPEEVRIWEVLEGKTLREKSGIPWMLSRGISRSVVWILEGKKHISSRNGPSSRRGISLLHKLSISIVCLTEVHLTEFFAWSPRGSGGS